MGIPARTRKCRYCGGGFQPSCGLDWFCSDICKLHTKYTKLDTGCWKWTAGLFSNGYGQFRAAGRKVKAHRWFYEYVNGKLRGKLQANHTCDNKWCVNLDHLWPGTQKENILDMMAKGRARVLKGEAHPNYGKPMKKGSGFTGRKHSTGTKKKMGLKGVNHPLNKLSEEGVQYIRMWATEGFTEQEIADAFKVSRGNVRGIIRRSRWKHLPEFSVWSAK